MTWQRLAVILTVLNFGMLLFTVTQARGVSAQAAAQNATQGGVAPVLRGQALELVDDRGRVRVQLKMFPADPNLKMPDGTTGYPEAVQLRLIDTTGNPNVKIVATEDGSGLVLGGDSGYVQILSRHQSPFVKLFNKDGREQTIALQGEKASKSR